MRLPQLRVAWLLAALMLVGCAHNPLPQRHMVAAAHPLATDAGLQMLRAGGTAIDAGIAVQLVLTLVEPQSSGIGGGVFIVHHDGKQVQTIDGRETAPAAATPDLFMKDGRPMGFMAGVVGGRSVGVPGTLRALELAHRQHGKLPWKALFQPAIRLAEEGFAISPRLASFLRDPAIADSLKRDAQARAYFYAPDGSPHAAGSMLRNPPLAALPWRATWWPRRAAMPATPARSPRPIWRATTPSCATHCASITAPGVCAAWRRRRPARSLWGRCWACWPGTTWRRCLPWVSHSTRARSTC
jgi:hypothetical protein